MRLKEFEVRYKVEGEKKFHHVHAIDETDARRTVLFFQLVGDLYIQEVPRTLALGKCSVNK